MVFKDCQHVDCTLEHPEARMESSTKMSVGAVLAVFGGIGMALGPTVGATELGRPWSFVAGFTVGIAAGIGVVLTISGLLDFRAGRT